MIEFKELESSDTESESCDKKTKKDDKNKKKANAKLLEEQVVVDVENHDILMDHSYAIVGDGEIPSCSYAGIDDEATQSGIPMSTNRG